MNNLRIPRHPLLLAMSALPLVLEPAALAGPITFVDLHPAGAKASRATGVDDTGQAGIATFGSSDHAGVWYGSAASFVDLHPSGAGSSRAYGGGGQWQGGLAYFTNPPIVGDLAVLWYGSSSSFANLDPGAGSSTVYAVSGSQQGGDFSAGPSLHPAVWTGWAGSAIDLTPAVATSGLVFGVSDVQQVGLVYVTNTGNHAALWSGTAASFVDLNPAGAGSSQARGVSGSHQAGFAYFGSPSVAHAALWSGTAASYVDLTPTGATNSAAAAISGNRQAGNVTINGRTRAALWSGTAASFVDLHSVLGAGYTNSSANGVWTDGNITYVAGQAYPSNSANYHAILWTILEVPPLQLTTVRNGSATISTLTWANNGLPCRLQSAASPTGAWSAVTNPLDTNPNWISTTVTNNAASQYFRLRAN